MSNIAAEIDAALHSNKLIARDDVARWIAAASDIYALSKLYCLIAVRHSSISPELGRDETCSVIQHYLLECIRLNVAGSEDVQDRWEAAHTLNVWFYHLLEQDASPVLKQAAQGITDLYLNGNDDIRDAIEMGFLEHALETLALRPYFEHWSIDDRLRPAWSRAMEWGKAHPDFMLGMVKQLRDVQS